MMSLPQTMLLPALGTAALSLSLQPLSAAFPELYLQPVVRQQFHSPTNIASAPDASRSLFVTDQPGRILIVKSGMLMPLPFLDISATAPAAEDRRVIPLDTGYSERGLLGFAFHPGYADPASPGHRKFYLNYNKTYNAASDPPPPVADHTPNCVTVISEFQVSATDPDRAEPGSERRLMAFTQPQSNHNGGQLAFGPDNMLYIAAGDGGSADDNNAGHTGGAATNPRPTNGLGNAQDKTSWLGKIHRINPLDPDGDGPLAYSIPADNPFVNDTLPVGLKKEIYAYGLRNPWRFSFDTRPGGTGRMFCCDVGQVRIEEVNLIVSGGNYGWRYLEGAEMPIFSSGAPTNPMLNPGGVMIPPIAQYAHPGITGSALPQLGLSGTGGYVYRGTAIPALQGKYVFGDYGATSGAPAGRLMGLEETAANSGVFTLTEALPLVGGNPFALRVLCLGEDSDGELYVGTKITGGVMALDGGLPNGGLYKLVAAPLSPPPVVLEPLRDSSLFSETGGSGEELANGAGNLFAGNSPAGDLRRALLKFDLSAIPAGTKFASASLQLNVNQSESASPGTRGFTLNKVLQPWGEGPSSSASGGVPAAAGDATWLSRVFSNTADLWAEEGGDFAEAASATAGLDKPGVYSWQGMGMLQDLRSWLADPGSNHGWILRSEEVSNATLKRIDSRESPSAVRPKLTLVQDTAYGSWQAAYFPALLTGQYLDPSGDPDGDGMVNQIEYASGLNPTVRDPQPNPSAPSVSLTGPEPALSVAFRRDAAATDTTIRLQISADLLTWTDLAVSSGGGLAAGANGGLLVSDESQTGSIRQVTVRRTLPAAAGSRQFVRLVVER